MASSSAQNARADASRCALFICFQRREGVRVSVVAIVGILVNRPPPAQAEGGGCAFFICFQGRGGVRVSVVAIVGILANSPPPAQTSHYFLRPPALRLRPPFLRGTFPPARRASLNPIAIACLRLF